MSKNKPSKLNPERFKKTSSDLHYLIEKKANEKATKEKKGSQKV